MLKRVALIVFFILLLSPLLIRNEVSLQDRRESVRQQSTSRALPYTLNKATEDSPQYVEYGKEFWRDADQTQAKTMQDVEVFKVQPFDVATVVDRVSHAFEDEAGHPVVRSGNYEARLGPTGVRFAVSALGSFPATKANIHLANVTADQGRPLLADAGVWNVRGNTAQRSLITGVPLLEHIEARSTGISFTWILGQKPKNIKELDFELQVQGMEPLRETSSGIHFKDEEGNARLRIGRVTAVDANQKKWPITSYLTEAGMRFQIPSEVITAAVYPLAIDPEISPEIGLDEPVAVPSRELNHRVAFNGEIYLCVWENPHPREIFAARFTPGGLVLDPEPIPIGNQQYDAVLPDVASDGKDFFVIWLAYGPTPGLYGTAVSAGGGVRPGGTLLHSAFLTAQPGLAYQDGKYLTSFANSGVKALPFTVENGEVRKSKVIAVHPQSGSSVISGKSGEFLVVSMASRSNIVATRINTTNETVAQSEGITSSANYPISGIPGLATNGRDYFVVWQSSAAEIYGRILPEAGSFSPPLLLAPGNGTGILQFPAAAWSDGFFGVIWRRWTEEHGIGLYGTRVSVTGEVESPGGLLIAPVNTTMLRLQGVPGGFAISHSGLDAIHVGTHSLSNPSSLEALETVPVSRSDGRRDPAVIAGRNQFLVAWSKIVVENNVHKSRIFGARVNWDGSMIDTEPFRISNSFDQEFTPSGAWNGRDYFIAWRSYGIQSPHVIRGTLVSPDAVVKTPSIPLIGSVYPTFNPSVTSVNGEFMVVAEMLIYSDSNLRFVRLGETGRRLSEGYVTPYDPPDGLLQLAPAVSGHGSKYLFVWREHGNGTNVYVRGQFYSATVGFGDVLTIAGPTVSKNARPKVANNSGKYLVTWEDDRDPNSELADIYGAVISEGVLLQTNGVPIVATSASEQKPSIVATSEGFLLSWAEEAPEGVDQFQTKAVLLNRDGLTIGNDFTINSEPFTAPTSATYDGFGKTFVAQQRLHTNGFKPIIQSIAEWDGILSEIDTTTGGAWKGRYGKAGSLLFGRETPAQANVPVTISGGNPWIWHDGTTARQAMLKRNQSGRVASCWYDTGEFSVSIQVPNGNNERVALYFLDWDSINRKQLVQCYSVATGALLDERTIGGFNDGLYLVYDLQESVRFQFTRLAGHNAVLSGIFFGAPFWDSAEVARPTFEPAEGVYIDHVDVTITSSTPNAVIRYTLNGTEPTADSPVYSGPIRLTSSARVIAKAEADGMEPSRMSWADYTIDHQKVATPVIIPGGGEYTEQARVFITCETAGATIYYTLDGSAPTTNSWVYQEDFIITRSSTIRAIAYAPDLKPSDEASATITVIRSGDADVIYLGHDDSTMGTWRNTYGQSGFSVAGDSSSSQPELRTHVLNASQWIWNYTTTDPAALQKATASTDRIAACWYSTAPFEFQINKNSSNNFVVSFYFLDWDHAGRAQGITVFDSASGAILDQREIASFENGLYLKWKVTRSVRVRITPLGGPNAVVSGFFFDPMEEEEPAVYPPTFSPNGGTFTAPVTITLSSQTPNTTIRYTFNGSDPDSDGFIYREPFTLHSSATIKARAYDGKGNSAASEATFTINSTPGGPNAAFVGRDNTTLGSWKGVYGSLGFWIAQDWKAMEEINASISGANEHVWQYQTTDPAALDKVSTEGRIAACWYSDSRFSLSLTPPDNGVRTVSLYLLDWDKAGRGQPVRVLNAATGAILDERLITEFGNGAYFKWSIQGNVVIQFDRLGGPNAVLSGIFMDW